jgi:hypothetical protein
MRKGAHIYERTHSYNGRKITSDILFTKLNKNILNF